ncbi:MAG: YigZ family protein [Lactobacillales bacterium]|nr:YigZ family protein [Lactobacillales bacterium]
MSNFKWYNEIGDFMYTIKENIENTIIINKSKFITYIIKINNEEEALNNLKLLKEKYKDATHHCYSYITGNIKRFNDDGEPGGTAGMPILNVLENNDLTNILCVVIRYFGGIKLGAGGLVRAYTKSVTEALLNTEIIEIKKGYKITIEFDYEQVKYIDNLLKNNTILNKEFNDKIIYTFLIEEKEEAKFNNLNIKEKENILF